MRVLEHVQQAVPQPVNWAVIVGAPIASFLDVVNPILQAVSFLVAIAWGAVQLYTWWKKGR
jgi:hypothetical protein